MVSGAVSATSGKCRKKASARLTYSNAEGKRTQRTVLPLALLYYIEVVVLAAWCELRSDFRHFRVDRIVDCKPIGERFAGEGKLLRAKWHEQHRLP